MCGNRIGAYSFVAAGAVVTRDVAAYEMVGGVPAKRIGWMCKCGVSLPKLKKKTKALACAACGENYAVSGKGDKQTIAPGPAPAPKKRKK